MTTTQGSTWHKWDLHVHTPDSLVHHYPGEDPWPQFLDDLEALPPEFKVLGINDYIFLEGYKKVLAAKAEGRLQNIELLLPVIELRLDMFGGSKSNLSRVNFHVIFSDRVSVETIESQFLNALQQAYTVTPEKQALINEGRWSGVPTMESLSDLGQKIIDSVPEEERKYYSSPIEEGFNNHCVNIDKVRELLNSPYFEGRYLTAVGKTEWADIKWNGQSIATKKDLINSSDLVFISSPNCEHLLRARESLTTSGVNDSLLDCSDAHQLSTSADKDRIGKCFTWVKSDTSFEGLRQAVHLYKDRIHLGDTTPIAPLRKLTQVTLSFPEDAKIKTGGVTSKFCFRGSEYSIPFSPNLTCIIGGRGSGKSTLLNLLHEKVYPSTNTFFSNNTLMGEHGSIPLSDYVYFEEGDEDLQVEFLQQNQIELFAADPEKLTEATYNRLLKVDTEKTISAAEDKAQEYLKSLDELIELYAQRASTSKLILSLTKSLATNKRIVASLESDDYNALTKDLKARSAENEEIRQAYNRFTSYTKALQELTPSKSTPPSSSIFDILTHELAAEVLTTIKKYEDDPRADSQKDKFRANQPQIKAKKQDIAAYLQSKGLTQESLNDATNATEQVEALSIEITSQQRELDALNTAISEFEENTTIAESYEVTMATQLEPINTQLSELSAHVKPIRLEYVFDHTSMTDDIHDDLMEIYALEFDGQRRIESIKKAFENINFSEIPEQEEFLEKIDTSNKPGKSLHTYFSDKDNYEIFLLKIKRKLSDVEKYKTINVFYDNKPITSTSFGQRCTTAIVILILLGNTPIIIDEPEAHLDSSLIAQYLVGILKAKKLERQIIFASHNANFVINGDSELIHILDMDEEGKTNITSSTIENLEHRNRLLALEGGKEAFKLRETRYGI